MKSLSTAFPEYAGKTAIVRVNFNVPIENGQVLDTTRIEVSAETVKLLRQNRCKVVLIAHAGRPEGRFDSESSLRPVATVFEQYIAEPVAVAEYQINYHELTLPDAPVVLIENLRFWPEEESNDQGFAKQLASLGDFFVNEDFSVCHRKHASVVGIPQFLPSFPGLTLEKEINALSRVRLNPEHPMVAVIGGAKLETKMPLVNAFAPIADKILVGGKIAIELQSQVVPANVVVATLTPDTKDITESSAREFAEIIMNAKTVIWNGTMGLFEEPEHELGTKIVAEAINKTTAFTLMGGGDTETALTNFNLEGGIDHISSGGGAMLTYLVDGKLVGVDALNG